MVVLAFAVWRVSSLVSAERGPWDVFQRLREMVGIEHDADGHIIATPETFMAGLISCVWCISVWLGGLATLVAYLWPVAAFWLALPLALSAAAIGLDKLVVTDG